MSSATPYCTAPLVDYTRLVNLLIQHKLLFPEDEWQLDSGVVRACYERFIAATEAVTGTKGTRLSLADQWIHQEVADIPLHDYVDSVSVQTLSNIPTHLISCAPRLPGI